MLRAASIGLWFNEIISPLSPVHPSIHPPWTHPQLKSLQPEQQQQQPAPHKLVGIIIISGCLFLAPNQTDRNPTKVQLHPHKELVASPPTYARRPWVFVEGPREEVDNP